MLLLNRVSQYEAENSMTIQNLAIVFGPTLFQQAKPGPNGNLNGMADAPLQNKVRIPPEASRILKLMLIAR